MLLLHGMNLWEEAQEYHLHIRELGNYSMSQELGIYQCQGFQCLCQEDMAQLEGLLERIFPEHLLAQEEELWQKGITIHMLELIFQNSVK